MRTDMARPVRLSDYLPSDYLIDTVDLDVRLDGAQTRIHAKLAIRPNPKGRPNAPLVLDGDELTATKITLDGAELDLGTGFVTPDSLTLEKPPQRLFELAIDTVTDPAANTRLMGLYRSGSAYCTQCEAEGFRRITYFLDRPDVLSLYTTRIEADKSEAAILLGNGNLVASGDIPGTGRHFALWHDPHPKPCYLFALVGGNLASIHDSFTTSSGRKVALGIYVEPGNEGRATYAMDALIRSMAWDEKAFGREYDLDVFNIVAVSDFNMGAMENKGLNVFNDKFVLAQPETATDIDYAQIESVIAHEYFHNWTGNRITCRDWFQLCLKEGLTVFRDQEFSSDERSRAVKRITDVRNLRANQFPEDGGPLAHNVRPETYMEINNFYTSTIYEKGSEVIRMLKTLIGPDAFARGMDLYFERCDGSAATMEDFVACFAQSSGRDLSQFFRWYQQAGTPVLKVSTAYDASTGHYSVTLEQLTAPTPGQETKEPFVIPVALGLVGEKGGDIALHCADATAQENERGVFELTGQSRTLVFQNVYERPALSVLRGFSAPVKLDFAQGADELLTLLAHDSDPFNRWQSAQTIATRQMLDSISNFDMNRAGGDSSQLVHALGAVLEQAHVDPAFTAQVLTLPSEADLARELAKDVDPDIIHDMRKDLRRQIGDSLAIPLLQLYHDLAGTGPYQPDAESAGRRALRNCALDLITAGNPDIGLKLAQLQFESATNMTDQIAALSVLATRHGPERETAFAAFYHQHAANALVVDKWFVLQATIAERDTLERVQGLMAHPAFSLANPNRVRALIGAFATGNPVCFHAEDGSGYDFLKDQILVLDQRNPQIAARLSGAFRTWRWMERERAAHAKSALQKIAANPDLSADVRDIVSRSLA